MKNKKLKKLLLNLMQEGELSINIARKILALPPITKESAFRHMDIQKTIENFGYDPRLEKWYKPEEVFWSTIPFGKYTGCHLDFVREFDHEYYAWLKEQTWFKQKYSYLD